MSGMSDISLYHLDSGLNDLLYYRAERVESKQSPANAEELAALDGEIRKYLEALPTKVDGVAAVLLHMRSRRESIKAEIDRLKALAASVESDEARLKGYVGEILQRQPEPKKGPRKLVGATSELRLVGNGGVAPLEITDPTMVPDDLCMAEVKLPWKVWMQADLGPDGHPWQHAANRVPNNSLIRAELEKPCSTCNGKGEQESGPTWEAGECPECAGECTSGVPGCSLSFRGSRVEVR